MKKAIITGITGQDAACLAQLLLNKGYIVYGTYRKNSSVGFWRIKELGIEHHANLKFIEYDLVNLDETINMLKVVKPDEVYNLAAQSHVAKSFEEPLNTVYATSIGVINILEAIRHTDIQIKLFQASSSEMFGKIDTSPQTEETKFYPRNPYGVSKAFAHMMSINYRESYNIFVCIGILYNHESHLRGDIFVTRKITNSVAKIKLGKLDILKLGNLDAQRDWGYAKEYIEAMYKMMQETEPDTYILATGKAHSVRHFVTMAFKAVDIELEFSGSGEKEFAIDKKTKKVVLEVNPIFYRPLETELLIGNPKKIKDKLGWESKTSLEDICKIMVEADLKRNLNNEL
jgi:GDPmannose 4,6-dehydratase